MLGRGEIRRALARRGSAGPLDLTALARHGGFAAVGSVLGALFGFLLTLVVTHGLSQTGAGQFFLCTAVFTVLQTLLSAGVNAGLARFVPVYRAQQRTADLPTLLQVATVPIVVASVVASAVLLVLAEPLAATVNGAPVAALTEAFHVVAILLVPATLEVAAVEGARALGGVHRYVVVQMVGVPLLRPVLVGAGIAVGLPLWGLILVWLVPLIVALVAGTADTLAAISSEPSTPGAPSRRRRGEIAREYWAFAAARGVAMVFDVALKWIDVILVAALVSAAQAAVYAAASRFITAGKVMAEAARVTLSTELSGAFARGRLDRVTSMYRATTQWVVLFTWPLYLIGAVFAPTVLQIFGHDYARGATAMSVLCIAVLLNVAAGGVETVLLMGGKSSWLMADKVICLVLNVVLNLVLIPPFGIVGAAVAWAVTIVVDTALEYAQVQYGLGVRGAGRGTVAACTAAVVVIGGVGVIARLVAGSTLGVLLIALVVGGALYAPLVWRFRTTVGLVPREH